MRYRPTLQLKNPSWPGIAPLCREYVCFQFMGTLLFYFWQVSHSCLTTLLHTCQLLFVPGCPPLLFGHLDQMSSLFKWWQAARECSFAKPEKKCQWILRQRNNPTWTSLESLELVALFQNWHVQSCLQESHPNPSAHLWAVGGKGTADCESRKKNVVGKYLRSGNQHANPRQPTNRNSNKYALYCHPTAEGDVLWNACLFWKELRVFFFCLASL